MGKLQEIIDRRRRESDPRAQAEEHERKLREMREEAERKEAMKAAGEMRARLSAFQGRRANRFATNQRVILNSMGLLG